VLQEADFEASYVPCEVTISGTAYLTAEKQNCVFIQPLQSTTDKNANRVMKFTMTGGTVETVAPVDDDGDSYVAISGNGLAHNTLINISGGTVRAPYGKAIYHPQLGTLNISNDAQLSGKESALEFRAGTLNITGGTFTSTGTPTTYQANGNGSTIDGATIAIAQHTYDTENAANNPEITVNIKNSNDTVPTFTGAAYVFFEKNANGNDATTTKGQIHLNIEGGKFYGLVYSEDATGFIKGGAFKNYTSASQSLGDGVTEINADYFASGYSLGTTADSYGYYTVSANQ
jgi:hypothetical protein